MDAWLPGAERGQDEEGLLNGYRFHFGVMGMLWSYIEVVVVAL